MHELVGDLVRELHPLASIARLLLTQESQRHFHHLRVRIRVRENVVATL
jgi:hypothetical protein